MGIFRKILVPSVVAASLVVTLGIATPATASPVATTTTAITDPPPRPGLGSGGATTREPAGVYYFECVSISGSSYWLKTGENLSNCKGAYLRKFIGGKMVQAFPLTSTGTAARPVNLDCLIAIVGTVASVITLSGTMSWVSLGASVYGLKSCKA